MILILDNYDSFTYNLAHAFGEMSLRVNVVRSDRLTPQDVEEMAPEAIVVSPGPGRPKNAGESCSIIKRFAGRIPILGVCLGHQCIAEVFGVQVDLADQMVHGKTSEIHHSGDGIYHGLDNPFTAARYHSLIVPKESISSPLEISAYTSDGEVMGIRSTELMVEGVQFHPESIASPSGKLLVSNFVDFYLKKPKAA